MSKGGCVVGTTDLSKEMWKEGERFCVVHKIYALLILCFKFCVVHTGLYLLMILKGPVNFG